MHRRYHRYSSLAAISLRDPVSPALHVGTASRSQLSQRHVGLKCLSDTRDITRFVHTLRAEAPGGTEAEVSLTLGATTSEAIRALCKAMGLEDHAQDLSLFLREESGVRILQASDRPLELYLQQPSVPDGGSPFLLRRVPRLAGGPSVTEGSPYSLLAVAQGIEDYMRLPVHPPEDSAIEFASLRLLLDKEPLSPGVVAQNVERYIPA